MFARTSFWSLATGVSSGIKQPLAVMTTVLVSSLNVTPDSFVPVIKTGIARCTRVALGRIRVPFSSYEAESAHGSPARLRITHPRTLTQARSGRPAKWTLCALLGNGRGNLAGIRTFHIFGINRGHYVIVGFSGFDGCVRVICDRHGE